MALPRSRTEGPTMPCPFCDATIRTRWNPHTREMTNYHGEDALLSMTILGDDPPSHQDAIEATELMINGLFYHLLALHGEAG
jgi:hypothetical protein